MNQCLLEDNMRMIRIGIDSCSRGRAHQIVVPVRLSHSSRGIECDQLLKNFSKLQSPTVAKKTSNLKQTFIMATPLNFLSQIWEDIKFVIPNLGRPLHLTSCCGQSLVSLVGSSRLSIEPTTRKHSYARSFWSSAVWTKRFWDNILENQHMTGSFLNI